MMVPVKYKCMHQTCKVEEFEKAEICIAPELHIIFCLLIDCIGKSERGENKCCSLDGLDSSSSRYVGVRRKMWSGYWFCSLRMLSLLKEIKEFVDGKWDIAP